MDLGIRLRELLYTRQLVLNARNALASNVYGAMNNPQQLLMSLPSIDALVDTWPLAALIDDARIAWTDGPTAHALPVLHRTAEIVGMVLGWPRSVDRRWPLPDEAWMREQAGDGPFEVVPRGPRDGASAAVVALDALMADPEFVPLPEVLKVPGDDLSQRRDDLVSSLRDGSVAAVDLGEWIPWDGRSQAALEAVREASAGQATYEKYGLAGLVCGEAPLFDDLLQSAPSGRPGHVYRVLCDALMLPRLGEGGSVEGYGVIAWDEPWRPVRVNPMAISLIEKVDGKRPVDDIAKDLDSPLEVVRRMYDQLREIGAITSV